MFDRRNENILVVINDNAFLYANFTRIGLARIFQIVNNNLYDRIAAFYEYCIICRWISPFSWYATNKGFVLYLFCCYWIYISCIEHAWAYQKCHFTKLQWHLLRSSSVCCKQRNCAKYHDLLKVKVSFFGACKKEAKGPGHFLKDIF